MAKLVYNPTTGTFELPKCITLPIITGDGTGPELAAATKRVVDASLEAAGGEHSIEWIDLEAGLTAQQNCGNPLPDETLAVLDEHLVFLKMPLTTPQGGGFRSINVHLRKHYDMWACVRPCKEFPNVPTPVRVPDGKSIDVVVFRNNREDLYAGSEFAAGDPLTAKFLEWLQANAPDQYGKIAFPDPKVCAIGLKPISVPGSEPIGRAAIRYCIESGRSSVTIVHKDNIQKATDGLFVRAIYDLAVREFGAVRQEPENPDWRAVEFEHQGRKIVVRDRIVDIFGQDLIIKPGDDEVVVTENLYGDIVSDSGVATVGGMGFAPSSNVNYDNGRWMGEATHGSAPKYTGQDKVNPTAVCLAAGMTLAHIGLHEANNAIIAGVNGALKSGVGTYDVTRVNPDVETVTLSAFTDAIIQHMA